MSPEAASGGRCFYKFYKIHSKAPVPESLAGLILRNFYEHFFTEHLWATAFCHIKSAMLVCEMKHSHS